MNAPLDLRLDKATFNLWLNGQPRRYEWKDGRVVQMNNVTRDHADIVSNIVGELRQRLGTEAFSVLASDFGIEGDSFVRFPDVLVEPRDPNRKGRRSESAILLFEVLSPSSVDTDLIEKPEEYMSFETLEAYVVASQDAAICWVWQRDPETRTVPARPQRIAGRDQAIALHARGIGLPLSEIYRNIPTIDD